MFFTRRNKEWKAQKALKAMENSQWKCRSCNELHSGVFDLGMASPSVWPDEETIEPNAALSFDRNFLSEDFCVIDGENFIVRGVLKFYVEGLEKEFGFGVWSSLSKANFENYLEIFDDGIEEVGPEWSSWFCSDLSYFGKTVGEKAWVVAQPNRQRPLIQMMDDTTVLGRAHKNGLAASTLIEIFEYYGHAPK